MDVYSLFKHKHIGVIGASIEGFATAKYLLNHGVSVTICDQKPCKDLGQNYQILQSLGASFSLGAKYLEPMVSFDVIFRTPGMSLSSPAIVKAQKMQKIITSQTKLFFDLCPCPIIGVTGTKGKGTTSSLIYSILKQNNIDVWLGGNIGVSPLTFLDNLKPHSWVVLELSSFQLEDLDKSPHISVVLMITQDHLSSSSRDNPNFHRSIREYWQSKSNIVSHQQDHDYAIINADYPISFSFAKKTKAQTLFFSREKKVKGAYLQGQRIIFSKYKDVALDTQMAKLIGSHNRENIMAAALTTLTIGISPKNIYKHILSFVGLEHRLEDVGVVKKIRFINDSFSTTPESTIAAVRSFSSPVILIVGGSEKGSDYALLAQEVVKSTVSAVILIGDTAEKIEQSLKEKGYGGKIIKGGQTMPAILKKTLQISRPGDTVLLSPACASFGLFQNYKERGKLFKDEIALLR